jgi:hypothetical protein
MAKIDDAHNGPPAFDAHPGAPPSSHSGRDVLIARDASAGPVLAVRTLMLQSSLAQLRQQGHFDLYASFMAKDVLEQLCSEVAPGWIPVELALAHYEACDNLMLTPEQVAQLGRSTGDRLMETTFGTLTKRSREPDFEVWAVAEQLHRIWGRLYQGGSVQVTRLSSRDQLIELFGFTLNRSLYYRYGNLAVVAQMFAGLGLKIAAAKIASYSAARDECAIRLSWL